MYVMLIFQTFVWMDYLSVGYYSFIFSLLVAYYLWYIYLLPKNTFKALPVSSLFERAYSFEENMYSMNIDTDSYKESLEAKYYLLFKAYLTDQYLYLYTQKNVVQIILCSSFSDEQLKALKAALRRHLTFKFIDYSN